MNTAWVSKLLIFVAIMLPAWGAALTGLRDQGQHEHLVRRERMAMTAAGRAAFVIMPFAEEFLAGYEQIIRPAVEAAGLRCVRADQQPQGYIPSQMFDGIFDAAVVVADISGSNPNVFYELGIAHSLGSRTITVAREDFMGHVPFDIASYRVLVYPKPADNPRGADRDAYRMRAEEARDRLANELAAFSGADVVGVSNPVQDYLVARSPMTSVESLHLSGFTSGLEEEMLRRIERELVHVSLTGASFIGPLAGQVEQGGSASALSVKTLLLDPEDDAAWRYVFLLREGRPPAEDEFEPFRDENRTVQARTVSMLERLTGSEGFSSEVMYYKGIPAFWAYAMDRKRLVVGHLALKRLGARNLPVHVIVRDDPKTLPVFDYYLSTIDSLMVR